MSQNVRYCPGFKYMLHENCALSKVLSGSGFVILFSYIAYIKLEDSENGEKPPNLNLFFTPTALAHIKS